jgi:hypothetical protein
MLDALDLAVLAAMLIVLAWMNLRDFDIMFSPGRGRGPRLMRIPVVGGIFFGACLLFLLLTGQWH